MATEVKLIYLDTNVLAYVTNTKAPQHRIALEIFRPSNQEQLCVSSQVMAELYSYLTNPGILVTPLSPQNALQRIKRICQMPHVLLISTPPNLFEGWMNLLETHPVTDGKVFDLLHIAIMLSHRVLSVPKLIKHKQCDDAELLLYDTDIFPIPLIALLRKS